MELIDARVRLPFELRAKVRGSSPALLHEQYDRILDLSAKSEAGTLAAMFGELDDTGIARAVIHAEYEDDADAAQLNDAVAGLVAQHPDRFAGVGTIMLPPASPGAAARQVDAIAALGLAGVNIQPAFFGMDIDDRRLYPAYARAEELGLVVALHTGINYSRMHPIRHERAELLDQVACDFPQLRLMACHGGWPWVAEYCAVARRHPTVYLEFGGLSPKYVGRPGSGWDVLMSFLPRVLVDQVLFGTDWPVMPIDRVLHEWQEIGLETPVLERLLGANARDLFWTKDA
ncbi:amidohydrolase family protein [Kribbella solani]|uniref:Putative TIM-barrel fold metal-dependent hydrolase n=1 Tax=Kribbella solani TaxID=236067 RepID=A0A841E3Y6_9ACTN|nr:amidohydrolase family protein [Kribbella solani]MBB5983715.1 putative TIM-barrel fold metal-dependent hydrolase [Kribbella solani]